MSVQEWTLLIGVVGTLAVQAAVLSLVLTAQTRWIKAEFGRIEAEFGRVVDRIDKLDTDVHAVIVRMIGGDSK